MYRILLRGLSKVLTCEEHRLGLAEGQVRRGVWESNMQRHQWGNSEERVGWDEAVGELRQQSAHGEA